MAETACQVTGEEKANWKGDLQKKHEKWKRIQLKNVSVIYTKISFWWEIWELWKHKTLIRFLKSFLQSITWSFEENIDTCIDT